MSQPNVVKQINILGIVIVGLLGALIVFELLDFSIFNSIQQRFVPDTEKLLFDHLKRLFIIGIFFVYSIFHYQLILKKYPALQTHMNRRLSFVIKLLALTFIALVVVRMTFIFTASFPAQSYSTLEEYLSTKSNDSLLMEDPSDAHGFINTVLTSDKILNYFKSEQKKSSIESGYCLYGRRVATNVLPGQSYYSDQTIIIDGFIVSDTIDATGSSLIAKNCPSEVTYDQLSLFASFHTISNQPIESSATMHLVGFFHTHPPSPNDNIFNLLPDECRLSSQDIFSFAQENFQKRAWIWGIACSNQKIFFYSSKNISIPINLAIISNDY